MTPPEPAVAPRRLPLLAIVLLVAAVALAFYIGTNVLGVLFAVISPPPPPIPPNLDPVSHTSESYGVDYWKFTSTDDACELVKYVQDHGGACTVAPLACGEVREQQPYSVADSVIARCSGQMAFSIFNEQYWTLIMRLPDSRTQFEAHREVFWLGTGPE